MIVLINPSSRIYRVVIHANCLADVRALQIAAVLDRVSIHRDMLLQDVPSFEIARCTSECRDQYFGERTIV
jgi:hypothetical protein